MQTSTRGLLRAVAAASALSAVSACAASRLVAHAPATTAMLALDLIPVVPPVVLGDSASSTMAAAKSRLGYAHLKRALATPTTHEKHRARLEWARAAYRAAESSWVEALSTTLPADERYRAQHWLADARAQLAEISTRLGEPVTFAIREAVVAAALDARDSPFGASWARRDGELVLEVMEEEIASAARAYVASGCTTPPPPPKPYVVTAKKNAMSVVWTTGAAPPPVLAENAPPTSSRAQVSGAPIESFTWPGEAPGDACRLATEISGRETSFLWVRPVPTLVVRWMRACDEYVARAGDALDRVGLRCQVDVANALYRYGRFDEAEPRLTTLVRTQCGVAEPAYEAWYSLLMITVASGDAQRTLGLMEAADRRSCAITMKQRLQEDVAIRLSCQLDGSFGADYMFTNAEKEPDANLRAEKFRQAADRYLDAVDRRPAWPEATRFAWNAAYASTRAAYVHGAFIALRLLVDRYVSVERIQAVSDDDLYGRPRLVKMRASALFDLGRLYLENPGLDGLLDPYRFDEALTLLTGCNSEPTQGQCPKEVDVWIERAKLARDEAIAADREPE